MSAINDFSSIEPVSSKTEFDDHLMMDLARTSPNMVEMMEQVDQLGFSYIGDTHSNSKACTDISKKTIAIAKDKTAEEGCLSLAYEMTNAINIQKIQDIHKKYFDDPDPTNAKARKYAQAILAIESEAIFKRSQIALDLGIPHLVKNQKYVELTKRTHIPYETTLRDIHEEMIAHGMVLKGTKRALDHYIEQYWHYNQNPSKELEKLQKNCVSSSSSSALHRRTSNRVTPY